jgi:hypothetical protein
MAAGAARERTEDHLGGASESGATTGFHAVTHDMRYLPYLLPLGPRSLPDSLHQVNRVAQHRRAARAAHFLPVAGDAPAVCAGQVVELGRHTI